MHRYYFKNFILASMLVMLSFLILGSTFIGVGRSITLRQRMDNIKANAAELSRLAAAYYQDDYGLDDWGLMLNLSSLAQSTGSHCFVCDGQGRVVSCSDKKIRCEHTGRLMPQSILDSAAESGGVCQATSLDGFYSQERYVACVPVYSGGDIVGYAFSASDNSTLAQMWNTLMNVFLVVSVSILVLTLIISYLSSVRQAKPINDMAEAALKFAHGDFSVRVSVDSEDEIGALASAFNQMAETLEQSEKRRSEFLANVAHELKTPMTTISGFADGILDGTIPPESERKYLETISSETKRLNRLVRRMLDMSKLQAMSTEEILRKSFDASELLLRTLLVFEKKINDKGLEVNVMVPEESIMVLGDADAINQVIYNLLENAVKFAAPGTELGVSIFKQDGKAYISIKNRGGTIPENELALIFDRFHKTDKSRSADRDGWGLGLYIVKSILNSHGEDIVVTSRDGVTEFVFSLTLKDK